MTWAKPISHKLKFNGQCDNKAAVRALTSIDLFDCAVIEVFLVLYLLEPL
jgi:hypothetical protein